MTGAAYWMAVGSCHVAAYTNREGHPRLSFRGEISPDNLPKLLLTAQSVAACIQGQPFPPPTDHPQMEMPL